jgi:DNA-binding response OmpR family regulator
VQPKLLVVEDDINLMNAMVAAATTRGYVAIGTVDASEVQQRVREFHPNIVLLDLRMGQYDGRDLLGWIKTEPETAATTVVIVSAMDDPHTVGLCLAYGAADFVSKPIAPSRLFDRLELLEQGLVSFDRLPTEPD